MASPRNCAWRTTAATASATQASLGSTRQWQFSCMQGIMPGAVPKLAGPAAGLSENDLDLPKVLRHEALDLPAASSRSAAAAAPRTSALMRFNALLLLISACIWCTTACSGASSSPGCAEDAGCCFLARHESHRHWERTRRAAQ